MAQLTTTKPHGRGRAKILVGVLIGLGFCALLLSAYLQFDKMRESQAPPEKTVLRSFDCLRRADVSGLRECYSDEAWAVVEPLVRGVDRGESAERLTQSMAGVKSIRIEESSINGGEAEVVVVIEREGGAERENFLLVRTPGGWRIR